MSAPTLSPSVTQPPSPPDPQALLAHRPGWSLAGVLLGSLGYVASMTPTLLPRTLATQLIASVLVVMTLYALGAIGQGLAAVIHQRILRRPEFRHRPRARLVASLVAIILAATATFQGVAWQREQFMETGVPGDPGSPALVIFATIAGCICVLYISRGLRALGRAVARRIAVHFALPTAIPTVLGGLAIVAAAAVLLALGFSASTVMFNRINDSSVGQTQPTSPLRSGSPASLIGWQSLGHQGRAFVEQGPTSQAITAVTDESATDPIRIYAGLQSADSLQAQAAIAVDDLRRAGGLDRGSVVVYTPSTNGLVDPTAAAAAEYVTGGDIASISMQYTVLPSSMSFLLSQSSSLDAGILLYEAVRTAIDQLPEPERPKLYVYGESLGAFGSQAPFAGGGIEGFTERADGALWAGPPANSTYWQEISEMATSGPAWQPIVDNGQVFRFAANSQGLSQPPNPWGAKRAVYLQNATDPVVWWSTDLVAARPGWLSEPRGPDVPAAMRWFPLLTFELVFVDMPAAGAMPPGIGHNYLPSIGPAWIAVMQPKEWSAATTSRMQMALTASLAADKSS